MFRSMIPWSGRWPALATMDWELPGVLERMFGPEEARFLAEGFTPRTNIAETPEAMEVTIELPGMKPDEFHVEVHENELWITGEKKEEKEEKGKTYHRMERRYGEFKRIIPLPANMNPDRVNAEYKEGVLRVAIGKREEAKVKQIAVTAA
jgi:HSP20 family protein